MKIQRKRRTPVVSESRVTVGVLRMQYAGLLRLREKVRLAITKLRFCLAGSPEFRLIPRMGEGYAFICLRHRDACRRRITCRRANGPATRRAEGSSADRQAARGN
jgi:hypothetical protein